MRFVPILAVALIAFWAGSAVTQDKGKKSSTGEKDAKKPAPITEIGGKTLDQWIAEISSRDRSRSSAAIKTILLFGPEQAQKAIPVILSELKKHRPPAANLDASVRVNAPAALAMILTSLKNPDRKQVEETIDLLHSMLKDPQIIIKYRAAQALRYFGPVAHETINELVKMVKDFPTWETRQAAIAALGTVALDKDGPSLKVTQALYGALSSTREPSSLVRVEAIRTLENLRVPENKKHQLAFEAAMEPVAKSDPDPIVRIWANLSLYDIRKTFNESRRAAIGKFLVPSANPETAVRAAAAEALGLIGPSAKDQVPALRGAVNDKEPSVSMAALAALGKIGPDAAAALPQLRALAADKNRAEPLRLLARDVCDAIEGKTLKDDSKKGAGK